MEYWLLLSCTWKFQHRFSSLVCVTIGAISSVENNIFPHKDQGSLFCCRREEDFSSTGYLGLPYNSLL